MADVQIPDLPATGAVTAGDLLHVRQGSTDNKITVSDFNDSLEVNIPNLDGTLDAVGTDSYILTPTTPITSYVRGLSFIAKFLNANTGASSMNVSGLGAKDLVTIDDVPLTAGDIKAGAFYVLAFDDITDAFHIINVPDSDYPRKDLEESITGQWTFPSGMTTAPIIPVINITTPAPNFDQIWFDDSINTFYFTGDAVVNEDPTNTNATINVGLLRLTGTGSATLPATNAPLQIGSISGLNIVADDQEIQARNNGLASTLTLNEDGGIVRFGTGTLTGGSPIVLDNNQFYQSITTLAATRDLIGLDNSNIIQIGDASQPVNFSGASLIVNPPTDFNGNVDFNAITVTFEAASTTVAEGGFTYNSIPAFNGGTSGVSAPFTVDSTFVVTNLNADLLDGLQGSAYALSSRNINSGNGLSGGGDLTADRTLNLDIDGLVVASLDIAGNDSIAFYDDSAVLPRKILVQDFRNQLVTKAYVDGLNIDADTLDGINGASLLRSDAPDTATGLITFSVASEGVRTATTGATGSPILTFYQQGTRRGYVQYNNGNGMRLFNDVADDYLQVGDTGILSFFTGASTEEFRVDSTGNGHFDGDVIAFSTSIGSDRRLKNIKGYLDKRECLKNISNLKPVEFAFKKDPDVIKTGHIAQEVQDYIPNAVKKIKDGLRKVENSDHYLAIDNEAIIANLVGAVGALSEEVNRQNKEIISLKEKLYGNS